MLHPALLTLMKLQSRAKLRAAVRGAKTPKGVALLVVASVILVLWFVPAVVMAFMVPRSHSEGFRDLMPLGLVALVFVSALAHGGDKAVSFTPAEVNFLFPGPFTRRQLLLYKVTKAVIGAMTGALLMSLAVLQFAPLWTGCVTGMFMGFLFLQFAAMAFVLTRQTADEATRYARGRRAVLFAVLAGAAVALAPAVRAALSADWEAILPALRASPAVHVLSAPAIPIAMTFTAQTYGEILLWGLAAAAVNAALLMLVLRLDANLVGIALEASRRQDEVLSRMRRGAWIAPPAGATGRAARLRVPMPPRLAGAGPVCWRQLATAARSSRGLLVFLVIFAAVVVPMAVAAGSKVGVWAVFPTIIWVTLVLTSMLKLDFRGDLDRMEVLKALPISPAAVATGQLLTPTLMIAVIHVALLTAMIVFVPVNPAAGGGGKRALYWALAVAPPLDLLMIGVENLVFLVLPARPAAATPGDLSAMGRHALLFLLKGVLMMLPCALAAGAGAAAYFALGRSEAAACVACVTLLVAAAVSMVPLVGWAFERFDPAVDVPA